MLFTVYYHKNDKKRSTSQLPINLDAAVILFQYKCYWLTVILVVLNIAAASPNLAKNFLFYIKKIGWRREPVFYCNGVCFLLTQFSGHWYTTVSEACLVSGRFCLRTIKQAAYGLGFNGQVFYQNVQPIYFFSQCYILFGIHIIC